MTMAAISRNSRSIMFLLLAVISGCAKTERAAEPATVEKPADQTTFAVQTDRRQYALGEGPFGPETRIHTTFTAPADRDVYLLNCNGAFSIGLQRLDGSNWVHAWSSEMDGCFSAPIVIPAGRRLPGMMTVDSGADALVSSRRRETKIIAGTYRAVWGGLLTSFDAKAHPPGGEELPLEKRVSAPFVIDAAPPRDTTASSPAQKPAEITAIEPSHGARAQRDAYVRVQLAESFPLVGTPHLYVDGEPVGQVPGTASEGTHRAVEYKPQRRWSPGSHNARVIYQNVARETRWYAWSFQVE